MAATKDLRNLTRTARRAGWTVTPSRGGHLRWTAPTGHVVFSAATPGDHRAVHNHLALLRRAGLPV